MPDVDDVPVPPFPGTFCSWEVLCEIRWRKASPGRVLRRQGQKLVFTGFDGPAEKPTEDQSDSGQIRMPPSRPPTAESPDPRDREH